MKTSANHNRRSLGLFVYPLFGLILFSSPAAAEVAHPVSGVFVAVDPEFPNAEFEICMSLRRFGVEAVSKKAIAELIIFTKDKRYDLKGDLETETTIKSIKAVIHYTLRKF